MLSSQLALYSSPQVWLDTSKWSHRKHRRVRGLAKRPSGIQYQKVETIRGLYAHHFTLSSQLRKNSGNITKPYIYLLHWNTLSLVPHEQQALQGQELDAVLHRLAKFSALSMNFPCHASSRCQGGSRTAPRWFQLWGPLRREQGTFESGGYRYPVPRRLQRAGGCSSAAHPTHWPRSAIRPAMRFAWSKLASSLREDPGGNSLPTETADISHTASWLLPTHGAGLSKPQTWRDPPWSLRACRRSPPPLLAPIPTCSCSREMQQLLCPCSSFEPGW